MHVCALRFVSSGQESDQCTKSEHLFKDATSIMCLCECRYLSRLLLLHGRWSFLRNREVVLYSFYKNWAYVMVYVYLQFVAGEASRDVYFRCRIDALEGLIGFQAIRTSRIVAEKVHNEAGSCCKLAVLSVSQDA
jgi:hypothetical protein